MQIAEPTVEISPSGLMDLANAAKYLNVKSDTVRYLRRVKAIPVYIIARKLQFKRQDLDAFIEASQAE